MSEPRPPIAGPRAALLEWYDAHRRSLPWRATAGERPDPYAVWVSEVMLQQTQVETVIPYFERFMARFPDPGSLAAANEDEVLSMWSGLGYYRRARLLHRGVKEAVAVYGGEVPEDPEARRALPGIGRYTAGAIGSIAFGREEPIVDGNVSRVLARMHGIDTPLGVAATERELWGQAERWVRGERPGDLNQALMELGAIVCRPKSPRCDACPISSACAARREGTVDTLPRPRVRRPPKRVTLTAVVAVSGRRVWLARQEGKLFGGLFAPPMAEGHGEDVARAALANLGLSARLTAGPHAEIEHVLTHRRLEVELWRATGARGEERDGLALLTPSELADVGVSSLTKRLLDAARPTSSGSS